MSRFKLLQCAEGVIITIAGILFTILSLGIRKNPVNIEGFLNYIVQAKFVPCVLSVLILLHGLGLTISQWKGNEKIIRDGSFTIREWKVVLLTMAYLAIVSYVGFALPTVIYIGILLFMVNRGRKRKQLLLLTVLYSIITLMLIPGLLNIQLL